MQPDTVIDLPFPPSTNKLWRKCKRGVGMMLSAEYISWKIEADRLTMALRQLAGKRTIQGPFEAQIILRRSGREAAGANTRGDLDNRIKATLDFAQRVELIADDKHCERLVVEWGEAPHGCRLILREIGFT